MSKLPHHELPESTEALVHKASDDAAAALRAQTFGSIQAEQSKPAAEVKDVSAEKQVG